MKAVLALAAVLAQQAASVPRAEQRTIQRHLRHRRRWRASRRASKRSPFATHAPLPDARNCSWKILTQKLDHFGSLSTTFDQRLCLYDGFATRNVTRVLLYVGNESPVEEYVNNTGLMSISASRGTAMPSRLRCDSCPSDEVVGGFFFDFEAIRTDEMLRAGGSTLRRDRGRCWSGPSTATRRDPRQRRRV